MKTVADCSLDKRLTLDGLNDTFEYLCTDSATAGTDRLHQETCIFVTRDTYVAICSHVVSVYLVSVRAGKTITFDVNQTFLFILHAIQYWVTQTILVNLCS